MQPAFFRVTPRGPLYEAYWHRPKTRERPGQSVLLVHGFTGSAEEVYRLYVRLGEHLAQNGLNVFRFSFLGHGNSDGDLSDFTLKSAKGTLKKAIQLAMAGHRKTHLVAYSLGAWLTGPYIDQFDRVAFWNPVAHPDRVFTQLGWKRPAAEQKFVTIGGITVSSQLAQELLGATEPMFTTKKKKPFASLLIRGARDSICAEGESLAWQARLRRNEVAVESHLLPLSGHSFQNSAEQIELMNRTREFLVR